MAVEAAAEHEQRPLAECTRTAQRCKGDHFVANETKIAAVRISANGWDASILHGLQVNPAHLQRSILAVTALPTALSNVGQCTDIYAL